MAETVSLDWVYEHLICEFTHWDICLTGLVNRDGERWFCRIVLPDNDNVHYTIRKVDWTAECDDFISDYRKAYAHWFHNGKWRVAYNGGPLDWFTAKWGDRNPIEEQARDG